LNDVENKGPTGDYSIDNLVIRSPDLGLIDMEAKDLLMLALTSAVTVCAGLLSVILWFIKRALSEMRERWITVMAEVTVRVSDTLCLERRKTCVNAAKCEEITKDFKQHTHTGLPVGSDLMIMEK
jgi:hypothetical protein